jgi:O-antigen/teichoic acid export membrane protein
MGGFSIPKAFAWLVSGRLAGAFISVISTAVLARLLTPGDFGVLALAMGVLAVSNVIFDAGFGINLIRKANLQPHDVRTSLTVALLVSLAVMSIILVLAGPAENFFDLPMLAATLRVASIVIPLKAFHAVSSALLQRQGRFRLLSTSSLVAQFTGYLLVAVPLSVLGAGVWALVAALVVSGLVEAVVTSFAAELAFRPAWDKEALRDVRASSLYSIASMMNWIANTGANAVVGRGLGAIDLGYYSRGWKLMDLFVAATATPLSRVLTPAFSSVKDDTEKLRETFLRTLHVVLPAYAAASALLTLQSSLIVDLALGSKWGATIHICQILFASLVPRCAFKVSEVFAVVIGRSLGAITRQGLYAILMVSGSIVGLQFGILGVAVAVSCAITIFYGFSMSAAIRIGSIDRRQVILIHVRAALFAGCIAMPDLGVLWILDSFPRWQAHLAAAMAGLLVGSIVLLLAPRFWIGDANSVYLDSQLGKRFLRKI